jgi:hypothetical protein
MADKSLITFVLKRQYEGASQELISTQKLQAHNGQFMIEGLPTGHYNWSMSYASSLPESERGLANKIIKHSGAFDLIALSSTAP